MSRNNGTVTDQSPLFRDFDAEIDEVDGDPVTFKLSGVIFTCIQPLPLGSILVMAKNALKDPENLEAQARQANILWSLVNPDQHEALDTAISKINDLTMVQRILEHIVVAGTGRPTPGS